MRDIEETGRTVEEAVEAALARLNLTAEEVEVEVIEEGSRGFMGILGGRPARVRVIEKKNLLNRAQAFIEEVVDTLAIEAEVTGTTDDEGVKIQVEGQNVGMLIGRRGQALDAWQYLTNLVANKGVRERERVMLDVAGYRARRTATLENLAERTAERVLERRRPIRLEPMSAADRRIIHLTLQDKEEVETVSEGREPYRRVVVNPTKAKSSGYRPKRDV
ncbi:MAG TPA: protein jag [Firmicutes bacterium]|nr:protein jag [Bacillota bacterium]